MKGEGKRKKGKTQKEVWERIKGEGGKKGERRSFKKTKREWGKEKENFMKKRNGERKGGRETALERKKKKNEEEGGKIRNWIRGS